MAVEIRPSPRMRHVILLLAALAAGAAQAQPAAEPAGFLAIILDERLLHGPRENAAVGALLQGRPANQTVVICSWQTTNRCSGVDRGATAEEALERLRMRAGKEQPLLEDFDEAVMEMHRRFGDHLAAIKRWSREPSAEELRYDLVVVTRRDIRHGDETIDQLRIEEGCFSTQGGSAALQRRAPPPVARLRFGIVVVSDPDGSRAQALPERSARYLALLAGAYSSANVSWQYRGQASARCPAAFRADGGAIPPSTAAGGSCAVTRNPAPPSPMLACPPAADPPNSNWAGTPGPNDRAGQAVHLPSVPAPAPAPSPNPPGNGLPPPSLPVPTPGTNAWIPAPPPSDRQRAGASTSQPTLPPRQTPTGPPTAPGRPIPLRDDYDHARDAPGAPPAIPVRGTIIAQPVPRSVGQTAPLAIRWTGQRSAFDVVATLQLGATGPVLRDRGAAVLSPPDVAAGIYVLSLELTPASGPCPPAPRLTGVVEVTGRRTDPRRIEVDLVVLACAGDRVTPIRLMDLEVRN